MNIEGIDFSVRAFNCLQRLHGQRIWKVLADLEGYSQVQMLASKGMGMKTLAEIDVKLRSRGIKLKSDIATYPHLGEAQKRKFMVLLREARQAHGKMV